MRHILGGVGVTRFEARECQAMTQSKAEEDHGECGASGFVHFEVVDVVARRAFVVARG